MFIPYFPFGYNKKVIYQCWKEHTCSCCGCVYSYVITRKLRGTGRTQEAASAELNARVDYTKDVDNDLQPCPTCGYYQEDMLGLRLRRACKWLMWASFIPVIIIAIVCTGDGPQWAEMTWLAVGFSSAILGFELLLTLWNPNRNAEANRALAERRVESNAIYVSTPGDLSMARPHEMARPTKSKLRWVALLAIAAAIPLAYWPEGLRAKYGWPGNEKCFPPVFGAGDTVRVYTDSRIFSVNGYWRGKPETKLKLDGATEAISLECAATEMDWGNEIWTKISGGQLSVCSWVDVTLPAGAELSGKTGKISIDVEVEFPRHEGDHFENVKKNLHRTVAVTFSPKYAGANYESAWQYGTAAFCALLTFGTVALYFCAREFQKRANPTNWIPVERPSE